LFCLVKVKTDKLMLM